MADVSVWANRIVGSGIESPEQLLSNPKNWRRHPAHQLDAMEAVLDEVGWVQEVIKNLRTGWLVDGHLRVELAKRKGQPGVPVKYVDLSEEDEAKILATLDPIGALATADAEALAALLEDVTTQDASLLTMLEDLREEHGIGLGAGAGLTDPDDAPEPPEEPITKLGDLWLLGEHRLLCGDATSAADVGRLFDGDAPTLMVTDPPYGVDYDPGWRNDAAAAGHLAYAARRIGEVANDDRVDWRDAWALFPGDVVYCWHAGRHASTVQQSLEQSGLSIRCQIIWSKSNYPISRGHYHWRHEPCWYAVRDNATAHWIGDRKQTTVWEVNLDRNVEGGHSTQKPVECMARPIRNHEGDVYDPFLGSGTTLIAAEQLGRRCYGMEISETYVDVAVARWEAFTGMRAELADRERASA